MSIYVYHKIPQYQPVGVSSELHLWFDAWVSLAALSVKVLGKYLLLIEKTMFIHETKLVCHFS